MSRIECFLIEHTGFVREQLRRFERFEKSECPGPYGYHNGHTPFGKSQAIFTEYGTLAAVPEDSIPAHEDPRWPQKCDHCEYRFVEEDVWQVFQTPIYHRPGVDEEIALESAPIGAIWDCPWFPTERRGPDGKCICIKTPGGEWMPDCPSSDGTPWTRTGNLPQITVRPSIRIPGKYHAFLTAGFLESCSDSPG